MSRVSGQNGLLRRVGSVLVVGLVGMLSTAAPAAAHAGDTPDGTNYRTEVTGVTPALPGLRVRVVEGGARLELENRTGRTVEVLGYAGEPYLEIRPDGVYENTASPATYLNRTLAGDTALPAGADPTRPPSWRRVDTEPVARWHDQRSRWLEAAPPPEVAASPDRPHRVRDWVVPLRDGLRPLELRGTLDWLPPPDPLPWWCVSLLGALAVGALGVLPRNSRPGHRATVALGMLAIVGGVAALCFALARGADAGLGGMLLGLVTGQLWPTLTGAAALAAGAYALTRRAAGDFALALAGTCLALFTGVTNAAVFLRSVVPVPWPPEWARVLVAVVIAVGGGLAVAGILRLRATGRSSDTGPAGTDARRRTARRWSVALPSDEPDPTTDGPRTDEPAVSG
ncbi:hypothetical protein GCM10022225_78250 [Plantactinospora mayteni]|uniref:Uncharacterized protein n=1 Tax=Plantactinospora mayteni TaxID=566021 RepID=A0ABQ4ERH1_9ACTN|nr:hypothetical protein [Plantactinospora mayteni]GIG97267.1 hypothetical protein Pma05_38400 [Plantactinospora mayteni]